VNNCSWGRGHPEATNALGEEGMDSDSDKKPRAGQILWIRGLTRLQTQVNHFLDVVLLRFYKQYTNENIFSFVQINFPLWSRKWTSPFFRFSLSHLNNITLFDFVLYLCLLINKQNINISPLNGFIANQARTV
jgi:Plasma membrane calcium transporter ATPase C terminal